MPLLLVTLQIFGTTSPSTEQLIEKYLADNPPEIRAFFRAPATQPYYAVLERLGVLRYAGRSNPGCDGTFPTYDISDSGYQIAKERGWQVSGSPGYLPLALEIPLGSYSLIRGSEHLVVRDENTAVVYFSYVLRGNANVSYLLSLATSSAWGDVGVRAGGYVVTIDKAGEIVRDKLRLTKDGNDWYVTSSVIQRQCEVLEGRLVRGV